jgi:hypothetical protein
MTRTTCRITIGAPLDEFQSIRCGKTPLEVVPLVAKPPLDALPQPASAMTMRRNDQLRRGVMLWHPLLRRPEIPRYSQTLADERAL